MADEKDDAQSEAAPSSSLALHKRLILARRAKFMAAAITGIGVAVACGGEASNPEPCLSVVREPKDGSADSEPQACLSVIPNVDAGEDANPQPCLSPLPPDSGTDGGDGGDAGDGG